MESFFRWFEKSPGNLAKDWLILGKGPSFSKLDHTDTSGYFRLSLNHAVRETKVKVAHIIDFDVAESLGKVLEENAEVVVLPWQPHVKNKPSARTLAELFPACPVLRRLAAQGRLLWYNLSSGFAPNPACAKIVGVRYFSIEAALNLLGEAGVRKIRTLGIDGGSQYSPRFSDLNDKTLLANGRESFDVQFSEISGIIQGRGIDLAPLDVPSPVRVFVGGTEEQLVATRVLEHSIRHHATMSVEVFPLHRAAVEIPIPRAPENRPRTPFTFQRFLIPELCRYRGRAIYLDSDMLLFDDIRKIWATDLGDAEVLTVKNHDESDRRPQFSVMLMDCAALGWRIGELVERLDSGELNYDTLVYQMKIAKKIVPALASRWNSLERFDPKETALLHYTDMNLQPWISRENPRGKLWCRALLAAVDQGFVSAELLAEHRERGWIRPSLVYQVEKRIEDPRKLPRRARALDERFRPPYLAYVRSPGSPAIGALARWRQTIKSGLRSLMET